MEVSANVQQCKVARSNCKSIFPEAGAGDWSMHVQYTTQAPLILNIGLKLGSMHLIVKQECRYTYRYYIITI